MGILNKQSLAVTVDNINAEQFFGRKIPITQRRAAAKWLASRQGIDGAYSGLIAPTDRDRRGGFKVFTGEKITSGAGAGHVLGEEGCRALITLGVSNKEIRGALENAWDEFGARLKASTSPKGTFCCASCSVALWRHLAAGGLSEPERQLAAGLKYLKLHRMEGGRWRRFPFYYTIFALTEIEARGVKAELKFCAPACERALRHMRGTNEYTVRCRTVLERALERL
ncbi:MAG TPA: hypothetical protein ENO21_04445 [Firmicutes bacterium]|nr:hypothetical protein [Bacillota bacterium]